MPGVLWVLPAVLLGCLLTYRFSDFAFLKPRWAAALLVFGVGTAVGIGLTSALFFVLRLWIPSVPWMPLWVEIIALIWLAYELVRRQRPGSAAVSPHPFPLTPLLAGALVLSLASATAAMAVAWGANPHGYWDAVAIWNLRARFLLVGGDLAHRAWSPVLPAHPEYPLLVSGFVARCWAYSSSISPAVPIATSFLFFLALVGMATGGVALFRSPALGMAIGLSILATPTLLHEVPAQYADIPLACYIAGAIVLAHLDYPVLAGVLASMAAWTKDEGWLFLLVFLLVTVVLRREHVVRLCLGALPIATLSLLFKSILASKAPSLLGGSANGFSSKLLDFSRYTLIAKTFISEISSGMAYGWYHPILPVLILAAALRFDRARRRDALFCASIFALMLLGDFAVYVITPYDLAWQLQTSCNRLLVQLWPSFLLAAFVAVRLPEPAAHMDGLVAANKARRKQKALLRK